jgi:hypothetical protein
MSTNRRKKKSFPAAVGKGAAKGLGKLATGAVTGVAGTLASIMTLGLYKPPRRRW